MIYYVPSATALQLSAALWGLSHAGAERDTDEVTTHLFGVVTARDGSSWLEVPDDGSIYLHPGADLGGMGGILQPWVADKRGGRMVVWEALTDALRGQAKAWQEMHEAGMLPASLSETARTTGAEPEGGELS